MGKFDLDWDGIFDATWTTLKGMRWSKVHCGDLVGYVHPSITVDSFKVGINVFASKKEAVMRAIKDAMRVDSTNLWDVLWTSLEAAVSEVRIGDDIVYFVPGDTPILEMESNVNVFYTKKEAVLKCITLSTSPPIAQLPSAIQQPLAPETPEISPKRRQNVYTCKIQGCGKAQQYMSLCYKHGGRRPCKAPGCNELPRSRGFCQAHLVAEAANLHASKSKQCSVPDCPRQEHKHGLCWEHNNPEKQSGRTCSAVGCRDRAMRKSSFCTSHMKNCITLGCVWGKLVGDLCMAHALVVDLGAVTDVRSHQFHCLWRVLEAKMGWTFSSHKRYVSPEGNVFHLQNNVWTHVLRSGQMDVVQEHLRALSMEDYDNKLGHVNPFTQAKPKSTRKDGDDEFHQVAKVLIMHRGWRRRRGPRGWSYCPPSHKHGEMPLENVNIFHGKEAAEAHWKETGLWQECIEWLHEGNNNTEFAFSQPQTEDAASASNNGEDGQCGDDLSPTNVDEVRESVL